MPQQTSQSLKQPRSERVPYLDTAKGILILVVLVCHFTWIGSLFHVKTYTCQSLDAFEMFWTPFFMAAFFCITGMCSSFGGNWRAFIFKGVKQILLPAVVLGLLSAFIGYIITFGRVEVQALTILKDCGGYWFLTSLFIAKVAYYFTAKLPAWLNLSACLMLYAVGCVLHITGAAENAYSFEQGLIFLPFMHLGHWLRSHMQILDHTAVWLALYPAIFAICLALGYKLPGVWSIIHISWIDILPHLVTTAAGILFVLALCKNAPRIPLLELCGKQSLFIYCLHLVFIERAFELFYVYSPVNSLSTALLFVTIVPFSIAVCLGTAWLFTNTRLKILMGKF